MATLRPSDPLIPTPEVATMAEAALYSLGQFLDNPPDKITLAIIEPPLANAEITLSGDMFRLVTEVLKTISKGHPVTILPLQAELSTQEAADILNVSRPYLVKLLDSGTIPSRKVGVYRRVLASDVLQYKQQNEAARHQALDELTKQAQELDMGY
ncbi:DNA-binding protein (plasmid) [Brasilonema octagenarum UFV-E1]|uniref:DNA-binding protein n=2 Tax=Brasilonema TaxID=383614 RepID=A0A856MQ58_9CYAN|nr:MULTISPECIES: helix-turn-helix domain-containing protein [Brasilonema]NMF65323.1 DNA-binding protein [Brasilonema octagenarum UFV-OR1]QDL12692.1 DNA-binding protein [Brasilonema sennae CENA114]QDL19087.1 DNA-binding protein [Brasilonema octagenarum UFV-E1]